MIEGIRKIDSDEWAVYFIDSISDALKMTIRSRLSSICSGSANADSGHELFSYKSTVKEFVQIYNNSAIDNNRKKGMIGELLFHVLMSFENGYLPCSLLFNLEENSFKKGFDLSFLNIQTSELWFAEVKSGEKKNNQVNQTSAVINLINTAKNDMKKRLSSQQIRLWRNAVHHARLAVAETCDKKKVILNLLNSYSIQALNGNYISSDKNVFLVGVLFHTLTEEVDPKKIKKKCDDTKNEALFSKHIIVAIQQNTYEEVFHFLEYEAADE